MLRHHSYFGYALIPVSLVWLLPLTGCGHREGLAKLDQCRLPGVDQKALCGELTVFENREIGSGRTIDLNIIVVPALDQSNKLEPIFYLEGGPGAAATNNATFFAGEGKIYREKHDVVLVDQRGTGKSNPLAAKSERRTPQGYLTEMYPVEYVKKLRRTLERKADLTQYTTSIAMDDLDEVRHWLGYDRINLVGLSYGTRAALVYMRQHPERVQTATLLGVAPTYLRMPLYHSQAAARAMELLLRECQADLVCHRAFPQVDQDWKNLLSELGNGSVRVPYVPDNGAPVTVEIERDIFTEKVRTMMYSPQTATRIPLVIHQAAHGDFAPFLRESIGSSTADFIADGMYLSVTCAEDVPFIDATEAAQLNGENPFGNYRVLQQTRACSLWSQGKIPPNFRDPVSSNIPVLIFSGRLDPVTPPERGSEVAAHLPNSRHVVIPQAGHLADGLSDQECIDRVTIEFMRTGEAKNVDVSCVEKMARPPFSTNTND